jgi:hypothetical protein
MSVVRLTMTPSASPIAAAKTRTRTGVPMCGHTSRTDFVLLTWSV